MSDERIVRAADLNQIERNLSILSRNLSSIAGDMENVTGRIDVVDNKVESVSSDLNDLVQEFRTFVGESKRIASLADAKQTVVMLEQELEKEYGNYDIVRKHTVGILQATDISIVKKETIENVTEELMLATPRYWLAPALIALSAWLGDNKEVADKALKEAIRRDDEKTSLLFCLISRRAGRLDGSLAWLERYFEMQDPEKMERKVIIILDAFASGLFGGDIKGICSSKIKQWLDELSSKVGFISQQRRQWKSVLNKQRVNKDLNVFPILKEHSETWSKLTDSMEFAESHENIYKYFTNIFNTPVQNIESISAKIDDILDSLVENYDDEELPLRSQLRRNRLIIEENGDVESANKRFALESNGYKKYDDFSQHLTNVALASESSGALVATQKLAVSLSKEWILDAYEDILAENRSKIPLEIDVRIENWNGKTRDGENSDELNASLNDYIDKIKEEKINSLKWPNGFTIFMGLLGGGIAMFTIASIIIPIISIALTALAIRSQKKSVSNNKIKLDTDFEDFRKTSQDILNGFLAEVVDYRRLYSEKDKESEKVINFLKELSPEQYIAVRNDNKVRQIL